MGRYNFPLEVRWGGSGDGENDADLALENIAGDDGNFGQSQARLVETGRRGKLRVC